MIVNPIRPVKIFYCYSHADKTLRDELSKQLVPLKHSGHITDWYDREIAVGTKWAGEIDNRLNEAEIVLLLISPDFMQSHYCYGKEMHLALERQKAGKVRVIPIILRRVHWEVTPIGELQVLPTDAKPVTLWTDRDEAFWDVVQGIQKAVVALITQQFKKQGDAYYLTGQFNSALKAYEQALQLTPNDADLYNSKGNALDSLHNYYDALRTYQQAINLDPSNARAYRNKASMLHKLKYHDDALLACEQAIRLEPSSARAYFNKGSILYELKLYEEAAAAYDQSILFAPDNALSFQMKGAIFERLGRLTEAQQYYKKARDLGYKIPREQT